MSLPELIEIIPPSQPIEARITVPGSKSITNRALILAALADGKTNLLGALWSEDTQVMVDCLQKLGFDVVVKPNLGDSSNRDITIQGGGGKIPKSGTAAKPLELFVGNAGTAARFLSAMVCLGDGVYRLHGVSRMHERPQSALFNALRELGYDVKSEAGNDKLPATIFGKVSADEASNRSRSCKVSIEESSQFASALLLGARVGNWKIEVVGENAEESPYVALTNKLIEKFPKSEDDFYIEPDASGSSYFWAADWFLNHGSKNSDKKITINHWPDSHWQIDAKYPDYRDLANFNRPISRLTDLGDSIMTAIVMAPLVESHGGPIRFSDLGRLRVQETERVHALKTELTRCGAKIEESGDTLAVYPSKLHGAEIETYHDHRMAMCFAILGLKVPGIRIKNPACVKKTFPNFFQKLAEAPLAGLGVEIWEVENGRRTRRLSGGDLFAD